MKKCGIITYHFATNYGAMLQCYALKNALENLDNYVEVLNYISDRQLDNNSLYRRRQGMRGYLKNLILIPFHYARKKRQDRCKGFRNKFIITGERIRNISELEERCNRVGYDYLISGSDQVWNPQVYDFDESFFFPFTAPCKKIGYAVSIGNATVNDLMIYDRWIKDFQAVTVREKQSINVIQEFYKKNAISEVVDPVFLLSKDVWENMIEDDLYKSHDYLLCYFVKSNGFSKKVKVAKNIAKALGLKLIIINARITIYNFREKVISDAGPIEFLSLIKKAKYICTDSFHGTAFSILMEKRFVTFTDFSEKMDNRKLCLLANVGLADRVFNLEETCGWDDLIQHDIDYSDVEERIRKMREESLNILREMTN